MKVDLHFEQVLTTTLIVLVIGQAPPDPSTAAFERAMRGVLGSNAAIQLRSVATDPADSDSIALAHGRDGVIELSWASDGASAHIHCYIERESRWIDREIGFGAATGSPEREAAERGRLLGFAVATMFVDTAEPEPRSAAEPTTAATESREPPAQAPKPQPPKRQPTKRAAPPPESNRSNREAGGRDAEPPSDEAPTATRPAASRASVEFAGIASSGIGGYAGGIGASVGLRLAWLGPLSARLFVAGRSGNIPPAQASTRSAQLGAGLALALLPEASRLRLGLRGDAFACYLDASHLSEDDAEAAVQSRWLPGADLVAEGGFQPGGSTTLFLGGGLEAVLGRTDIYTHQNRVAVVPVLRLVGEVGLRTHF